MQSTFNVRSVRELIDLAVSGKLNPDPISQRPPTSSGHRKSQEIIEAIFAEFGVGMITVRNIQLDPKMQEVYPGVAYLVIDGGHRIRALVDYYTNKFKVNGQYYKEFDDNELFLNYQIAFESIVCTSSEATKVFKTRNKTTSVNLIEMIMCDDESVICREVRSRTKYYREYKNTVHPLFSVYHTSDGELKSDHFDSDINPRRKWDQYVFTIILKVIGNGNVDAGFPDIEELIMNEYIGKNIVTKRVLADVDRFLDDMLNFRYERAKNKKLNGDIFAAFQAVWFALYEQNREFKITNSWQFMNAFMEAYVRCTGSGDRTFNNRIVDIGEGDDEHPVNFKEFIRANTKKYASGYDQRKCAKFLLEEMGTNIGVTFRDNKRSLNTKQREEQLAIQGYKCAISGEPLKLDDSVWGHDVSWAEGGATADGKVIHKKYNSKMGQMTIAEYTKGTDVSEEEYKLILELRKNKVDA